jgi:hypothetical protein
MSEMKTLTIVAVAALLFTAVPCFADHAMTCGTNLVSVGDSKTTILKKCGEPAMKDNIGGRPTRERWTYNFGGSEFMKILVFDGDTLDSIEEGPTGFEKK